MPDAELATTGDLGDDQPQHCFCRVTLKVFGVWRHIKGFTGMSAATAVEILVNAPIARDVQGFRRGSAKAFAGFQDSEASLP